MHSLEVTSVRQNLQAFDYGTSISNVVQSVFSKVESAESAACGLGSAPPTFQKAIRFALQGGENFLPSPTRSPVAYTNEILQNG